MYCIVCVLDYSQLAIIYICHLFLSYSCEIFILGVPGY